MGGEGVEGGVTKDLQLGVGVGPSAMIPPVPTRCIESVVREGGRGGDRGLCLLCPIFLYVDIKPAAVRSFSSVVGGV